MTGESVAAPELSVTPVGVKSGKSKSDDDGASTSLFFAGKVLTAPSAAEAGDGASWTVSV